MADDIGDIKEIRGTSMALNGQKGQGAQKPSAMGKDDPGGTKPPEARDEHVPMPK
jgi:hypothetical protein